MRFVWYLPAASTFRPRPLTAPSRSSLFPHPTLPRARAGESHMREQDGNPECFWTRSVPATIPLCSPKCDSPARAGEGRVGAVSPADLGFTERQMDVLALMMQ